MNYVHKIFNDKYKRRLKYLMTRTDAGKLNELKWLESHVTNNNSLQEIDKCINFIASKNSSYVKELITRLNIVSFTEWLSVISEIFVTSYISENICANITVQPKSGLRVPDFLIEYQGNLIFFEVKTIIDVPKFRSKPFEVSNEPNRISTYNNDLIRALKQLPKNNQNIVIFVDWKIPSFSIKDIKNAIWGEDVIMGQLNTNSGIVSNLHRSRVRNGAKIRKQQGTRIGAID